VIDIAGALGFAHVLGEQTRIGLAHPGQHFTRDRMDNLIEFEAFVRLAPAEDRNLHHSSIDRESIFCALSLVILNETDSSKFCSECCDIKSLTSALNPFYSTSWVTI
jgi:hypothetical protein